VSHNGGTQWERIGAQGDVPTIWSLAIDPVDPRILFAGTRPAGVYRSRDGGRQWEKLAVDIAQECSIGTPFVTSVMVDPDDHRMVWAGVEIDGVFRSLDGGDTWTHVETGLYDPDIHAMTIAATQPKRVYASTAREVFASNNMGETWQPLGIQEKWPLPYARGIAVKADDPEVLFTGCGETTTGEKGHVVSSQKSVAESPCCSGLLRGGKTGILARSTRHVSPLERATLCSKTLTCTASQMNRPANSSGGCSTCWKT
jgi:photosystem II stability/assembly factor-like uncharacterized protein